MKMPSKTILTAAALAAVIGMSSVPNSAHAEGAKGMEKCYGVVKAGKNDCASAHGNSCAGTSKADGDKHAWVMVPAGLCDKLVGGSTTEAPKG